MNLAFTVLPHQGLLTSSINLFRTTDVVSSAKCVRL